MQAPFAPAPALLDRKPMWPPVVVSGLLRGLLGCVIFFNLISQLSFGSLSLFLGLLGGVIGNLAFLGVVGLVCSLVTQTGGVAYRIYARSFLVAVLLYLVALPAVLYVMPQIPADASLGDVGGIRAAMMTMRGGLAMETFRYTQLTIFVAQMILTYLGLSRVTSRGRAATAVLICLTLYLGLFVTRVI